jgi:glutamyl-tRNA synthetase
MGNARTAVLNWLFARRHEGAFILRFEDTDRERLVESAEREIVDALDWLGLDRDEGPFIGGSHGPYRQSERYGIYRDAAARLLEDGRAYRCYCTPEELEARRVEAKALKGELRYDGRCRQLTGEEEARLVSEGRAPSVRFRVEPGQIHYADRVRGDLAVDGEELGDQVILRSDGRPTYNFAVVVDDHLMEITHVIRGAGHLSNTPKQVLFYAALGAQPPEFLHLPSVLASGGGKLSKRAGATGLLEYRREGYHADGVLNYLSLLSWSSPSGDEVLSRGRLIDELDLDRIGKANPELDPEKLRWLSGQHYRTAPIEQLMGGLESRLAERFELDASLLRPLAEVLRDRILVLSDADAVCELVLPAPKLASPEARDALEDSTAEPVLRSVRDAWAAQDPWTREALRATLLEAGAVAGVKGRQLYHPVRAALTDAVQGPDVPDVAYILGRERSLDRIDAGLRAAGEANA